MKVWGIDPSSKCGIAIWDTKCSLASVHCEVIDNKVEGDYYWYAAQMGRKLRARVNEFGKPHIVVIEQGSESTQGTGVHGVIWSWNVIGAIVSIMGVYGMPIATITPGAWRKPFYGKAFVPPQLPVTERVVVNGQKVTRQVIENGRPKFKTTGRRPQSLSAKTKASLPTQKTIAHNAAEAVGIAHSWYYSKIINKEYEKPFMSLKDQRNERTPSGDLFAGVGA